MENNLPELRDIHLPEEIGLWPLAYGWWVALAFLFLFFLLFLLFNNFFGARKKKYVQTLVKNISEQNNILAAREISEILKRICLLKYPQAVSFYGEEWLEFLNCHCSHKLSGDEAKLLITSPYLNPNHSSSDVSLIAKLKDFAQVWIGENL